MSETKAPGTKASGTKASGTKRRRWPFVVGGLALVLIAAVAVFRWDWLIPVVNAQASKALGRPVTITHLHVRLGRVPHIEADGVTIANPADWPGGGNFATADRLSVDVDAMAYIRARQIVIPDIAVERPQIDAQQLADGRANWTLASDGSSTGPGPKIGNLRISDGHAHVVLAKLRSDFNVDVATQDAAGQPSQIVASAQGTYAAQPISAQFTGGALLSLRDESQPYPVDLQVANGPTKVSVVGTIKDPLAFAGADLKLDLAGPDMTLLQPLTGVAIPKTPPYRVTGSLDYTAGLVKFTGMNGKFGSSDLNGDLQVDTKPERPVLTAELQSKLVDLKDLGGFIGADPGDASKGTKRPAPSSPAASNARVLPSDPISLPRLNVADVHLKYRAGHIQGRSQPIDNMRADLDIVNGAVSLAPLSFGIGRGQIVSDIKLAESGQGVHAKTTIDFQRVDVDKLVSATGAGRGAGAIGGRAVIDGTGRSMAEILGHGNGELKLYMGSGGNISALLVDLSGLEFGNAVLSALGVPTRATVQCLITDFVLQQGVVDARTVLLDTDEARVGGKGSINLRDETLKLVLNTESKHFSVGSLPAPVNITGTFAKPSVLPDLAVVGARAGAAVGLGILLTPLGALLPTIQLGTGEDGACAGLLASAKAPPSVPARPPARSRR